MKYVLMLFTGVLLGVTGMYLYERTFSKDQPVNSLVEVIQRPLDEYSIENLSRRKFQSSVIMLGSVLEDAPKFTSYDFAFTVDGKKVTGFANIPKGEAPVNGFPVIIQLRGYVPKEIYEPGIGTKRSGQVFASHGFITFSPDFLGYGGSDKPSADIFEERFQTYVVAASLIASVGTLKNTDQDNIGIWAHSNGGQIALTTLEFLGKDLPTVLWAPVTKVFPYSILYYTDEASDSGKFLRRKLAEFESLYDTDLYALTKYINRIHAPLSIHQGAADEVVPRKWTDEFVLSLKEQDKDVTYYVYPGADHNLNSSDGNTWSSAVMRSVDFFTDNLKSN